jgi:hypothetical protein
MVSLASDELPRKTMGKTNTAAAEATAVFANQENHAVLLRVIPVCKPVLFKISSRNRSGLSP